MIPEDWSTELTPQSRKKCIFRGALKLFFGDHPPPHFHAGYGGYVGLFNIDTLEMIEGDLPKRAKKLVIEWATINKGEMKKMWNTQKFYKLPPLE